MLEMKALMANKTRREVLEAMAVLAAGETLSSLGLPRASARLTTPLRAFILVCS